MSRPRPPHDRHTVRVGSLTANHIGRLIQIRGLHQPGLDWAAPKVTVTGTLDGIRRSSDYRAVWLDISPKAAALDSPLPIDWFVDLL